MLLRLVMPHVNKQIDSGVVVRWHKREGEPVAFGEAILDVQVGAVRRLRRVRSARVLADSERPDATEQQVETVLGSRSDVIIPVVIVAAESGYLRRIEVGEGGTAEIGKLLALLTTSSEEGVDESVSDGEFRVVADLLEGWE